MRIIIELDNADQAPHLSAQGASLGRAPTGTSANGTGRAHGLDGGVAGGTVQQALSRSMARAGRDAGSAQFRARTTAQATDAVAAGARDGGAPPDLGGSIGD